MVKILRLLLHLLDIYDDPNITKTYKMYKDHTHFQERNVDEHSSIVENEIVYQIL